MLILTRRIGETLYINDDMIVTVLDVRGNQVRIGVTAPKNVPVHREEIWRRIQDGAPDTKREALETGDPPTVVVKPRRRPPPA